MKTKLLSMLLLAAMLLTGIPVMAVSAEEAAPATKDYDYHDLYVKDGLKVLLTAIDADEDDGIVLSNGIGTWKNRVNGTAINALRSYGNDKATGEWRVGANGGIGFPVYAGQVDVNGKYSKYSVYNTLAHGEYTENGTTHAQNRKAMALMLDAANLPTGSFTVEYLAQYNHLEAVYGYTDEAKGIVEGASAGDIMNYSTTETVNHEWAGHKGVAMTDHFGHLSAWTSHIDGYFEHIASHGRGSVVWMLQENMTRGQFSKNQTKKVGGNGLMKAGEAFHQYDAIHTYTVSLLKENYTGADEAEYLRGTYTLLRDRVTYQSAVANSENPNATDGTYFPSTNHRTDNAVLFCLSYSVPTDFYGVRVYNRVLSADEQAWNHIVDMLEYYNLAADTEWLTQNSIFLSALLGDEGFEMDAVARSAKGAMLQLELNKAIDGDRDYHHLYVQDGLTGLFTAIDANDETVSLENGLGTWVNRVNGKKVNALRAYGSNITEGEWRIGENGGVGFPVYAGQVESDRKFTKESVYNTIAVSGDREDAMVLDLGGSNLPTGDFTVEYLAKYNHIEAVYGYTDEAKGIVEGASAGDFWGYQEDHVETTNTLWGGHRNVAMVDYIGHLTFWTTHLDSYLGGTPDINRGRGAGVWLLAANLARGGYNANATRLAGGTGLINTTPFHQYDTIHTYTITLDKEVDSASSYTNATYTLLRDRAAHATASATTANEYDSVTNGTAFPTENHSTVAGAKTFFLSYSLPTDFYGVRIYSKVLSVSEQQRNHAVDILEYYNLEADAWAQANISVLAEVLVKEGFEMDAVARLAKTVELQAKIKTEKLMAEDHDYHNLYVQDGLKVLLTAIDADEDDGIVLSNGIGTWKNRVNDTAINALRAYGNDLTTGQWRVGTNGGIGFPVYAGQVNADDSYSKYSVYNTLAHGAYTENGTNHAQNRKAMALMLDAANLPTGSFTVEYLAQYNHLEAVYGYTDEANGIVEGASAGDVMKYSTTETVNHAWAGHKGVAMTDHFGHLSAWTTHIDGYFEHIASHGRGSVVWILKEGMTRGQFSENQTKKVGGNGLMKEGEAFHQYDAIHTYTVSLLKEDYTGTDGNAYLRGTYTLLRDRVTYQSAVANSENPNATDGTYFPSKNHSTSAPALFCLSYSVPTDFYGVRVYNRVLSAEEQRQNHAVDILEYYNLTVSKTWAEENMSNLGAVLAHATFVTDAMEKGLEKLKLQAAISTLADAPVTNDGVTVKVTDSTADVAMRFTASLSRGIYNLLVEAYGAEKLTFGILITPDVYVQRAGAFTRDALRAFVAEHDKDIAKSFVEIRAGGFYAVTDTALTIAGSLHDFSAVTKTNNPAFAAVAFIDVDVDMDGYTDFTVYGNYNPTTSRDVKTTLYNALQSATGAQAEWINALYQQFDASNQ